MCPNLRLAVFDRDDGPLSALAAAVGAGGHRGCDPGKRAGTRSSITARPRLLLSWRASASVKVQAFVFLHDPTCNSFFLIQQPHQACAAPRWVKVKAL